MGGSVRRLLDISIMTITTWIDKRNIGGLKVGTVGLLDQLDPKDDRLIKDPIQLFIARIPIRFITSLGSLEGIHTKT